jgi:pimeloyl-ACP methyl ester carboxylesterase
VRRIPSVCLTDSHLKSSLVRRFKFRAANEAIGKWAGIWSGLRGISAPTLFVTGTEDVLTPPANAVKMAAVVPGSWLERFPGAGHGLMYQDPRGLAATVLSFP